MPFNEQLPEWNAPGIEPPASKKNIGWQAGEKPPADYWNWQMNRTYKALQELQQKALNKDDVKASDIPIVDAAGHFTADNVEGALNELFTSVSDGKSLLAGAITDKGVPTSPSDTFQQMANNIQAIPVGPDTSDATATPADILSGKTAYGAAGTKMTGTMPNIGNTTVKISTLNDQTGGKGSIDSITEGGDDFATNVLFRPPKGYYDGVNSKINLRFWGIKPEVVKAGQKIGWTDGTAMTGTFTSDANAGAGDILSGKTAYVNGAKVTGSMPNRGNVSVTLTQQGQEYTVPAGYHAGAGKVKAQFANLIPENIREGVNIGGVVGTLVEGKPFATGTTPVSGGSATISGLAFRPTLIVVFSGGWQSNGFFVYSSSPSKNAGIDSGNNERSNIFSVTSNGFTITTQLDPTIRWYAFGD